MPTSEPKSAITADRARFRAGDVAFPALTDSTPIGRVGLEPEYFPIFRDQDGRPAGRVPLQNPAAPGVLDVLDEMACDEAEFGSRRGGPVGPWEYRLADGGRITFEPGAQVEHSTAVYPSAAIALGDVQRVLGCLRSAFLDRGAVLAAAGMDVWHDVASVPQQLPFGRYTAQAAYYERRGTWGRVMMRHTASLQINLDLGPEGVWQERWLVANLVSPLIIATFACSPGEGGISTRAHAWQQLDPSRSGFPEGLMTGDAWDPRGQWADAAMAADVMLFRASDGSWAPGEPGFDFGTWIRDGHPEFGWPTEEDLDYHLTTIFLEVRPRGFLELRAGEAVPDELRAAQVVLVTSLLYDDQSRRSAVERLEPQRHRLPELWRRAARVGVGDSELQDMAVAVWEEALRGAERLGDDIGSEALVATKRFLERFTFRGRTPADELRDLLDKDPAEALAWAASDGGSS
jgi:glutamate--cysteine ligase